MEQPIKTMLDRYAKSGAVRLHMPSNRGTLSLTGSYDITELPFSDDLSNPTGVIAHSCQQTAELYSCRGSQYLVNGSTVGVLAMIASAKGKIYLQRNSHKVAFSALRLYQKEAYVEDNMQSDFSSSPVTLEQVKRAVSQQGVGTVFLTTPDYFGQCADIKSIYEYCQDAGVLCFVDGAHGGHHAVSRLLPPSVTCYSDVAVISAHKDLGALTQTAILTYNNLGIKREVLRHLNTLTTTSPSYLLLESIERAVVNAFEGGNDYAVTAKLRARLQTQTANYIAYKPNDDFTRVVIDTTRLNASGKDLYDYLVTRKIFCELFTRNYLILLLSPKDDQTTIDALSNALIEYAKDGAKRGAKKQADLIKFDKSGCVCNNFTDTEWIPFTHSVGRVSANCIGVAPPCIPVVLAGQTIGQTDLTYLKDKQTFNIYDGDIEVVK